LNCIICKSYCTAAQPATNHDGAIFKVLLSINLGTTRRLRVPCRGQLTARRQRHSDQVQYLTQHNFERLDVLLITKLETLWTNQIAKLVPPSQWT